MVHITRSDNAVRFTGTDTELRPIDLFGGSLLDCLVLTDEGPVWFTHGTSKGCVNAMPPAGVAFTVCCYPGIVAEKLGIRTVMNSRVPLELDSFFAPAFIADSWIEVSPKSQMTVT